MRITTRTAFGWLTAFWLTLLPLFVAWLALDQTEAPWDQSLHSSSILRLHDGLVRGNLWRAYELSRFYPPLFHVLAVPASFVSTHPDAYCFGNWLALLAVMWGTFLTGRALAGSAAGLVGALVVPAYGWVTWMGRMPMTDLTLTATVILTLAVLVRPIDLTEPRHARWLGIAIALGMLAKWPYVLFTFLPLARLGWAHWVRAGRVLRARAFWRPLATVLAWPLVLAGPWYARSLPSLLGNASWHLGSGVVVDEGDPPLFSLESLEYYPRQLWAGYLSVPLLLLLAAGLVVLLLKWRDDVPAEVAPPARWAPLGLSVLGGLGCILLIANKDARYLMPMIPVAAVVSGAWLVVLGAVARRRAIICCAVLGWTLVADTLFRVSPPDRTDWKVAETAAAIATHFDHPDDPGKVLVVPNDLAMNSNSLSYALQRISQSKVNVERANGVPDEAKLREFEFAVAVLPPPEETPVSRDSAAAARFLLSRPDWAVAARLTRGDDREIVILGRSASAVH